MGTRFALIGSGLAGGLLAGYLGRRGYEIDLYERRADPRAGNTVGGRSINLALSTRGIHALQQLGIADEVLQHAIPMR
ncbi:MAG TPA: NAD(P)-binding protein, partial [Chthoniobacterales bacterium]